MKEHVLGRLLVVAGLLVAAGCYDVPGCVDCADGDADSPDGSPYADSDGDTVSDGDEGAASERDTDGDTVPDYLDTDSDGDGWLDSDEAGDDDLMTPPRDTDSDGTPDIRDTDSDGNGIGDRDEGEDDMDGDTVLDVVDMDDDGDGCIDAREGSGDGIDTDGDTAPDHRDGDADGDGIADEDEGCLTDCDDDLIPNRVDTDSDDNGLSDAEEGDANTDETSPTGPDDVPDYCDVDNDGDGIRDEVEIHTYGTDHMLWDTDADGEFDYLEIVAGSDPLDDSSTLPGDLLVVGPSVAGTRFTVTTSIPRVDLSILASTAGDLAGELADLAADLPGRLDALAIPDLEVSVVAYEDFGSLGYGPSTALPVQVLLHSTPDPSSIASALSDLEARGALMAGTIAERTCAMEAVFQVITGEGLGGGLIPHATCTTSPLEPARFGLPCLREDSYTILAVVSDRLAWNGPGCTPGDASCEYDDDDFPPLETPTDYAEAGGRAYDKGVRALGIVPDPDGTLPEDPSLWIERLASDTGTVDGSGDPVVELLGTDAGAAAERLAAAVETLVTASPFGASFVVVDLPDEPPQQEISVNAYSLMSLAESCDPPSSTWGPCTFSGPRVGGVGAGVDVTARLVFSEPSVHRGVEVLAFEVRYAVEDRLVVETRRGYLVVPQTWNPEL